ncbi:MAG TPA: DUF4126 family protein [Ktedonobacteraceae bacterium]
MAKDQLRESRDRALGAVQDTAQAAEAEIASWREELTAEVALRALTLGFVGGLRSLTPLALLDLTNEQNPPATNNLEQFLDSPTARVLFNTLAAGELVADKLPFAPSRLSPIPLLGRLGLGALAGMSLCRRYHKPLIAGALLGGLGAGAGSFAGYYARSTLFSTTKTPQWVLGLAEDALAFGLGSLAVKRT